MRSVFARSLILALALAFSVCTVGMAGPNENAGILEIAKAIEEGKDSKVIAAKVAAYRKKFDDLEAVMHSYKPKDKGGIGYAKETTKVGLERKIQILDKDANLPAGTLQKEGGDLTKLAYITLAMAELTTAYAPEKMKGGKGKKEWNKFSSEQKTSALDLLKAIKANDAKAARAAIKGLNGSCSNCHSDFR